VLSVLYFMGFGLLGGGLGGGLFSIEGSHGALVELCVLTTVLFW
jgi:hypothetical protein